MAKVNFSLPSTLPPCQHLSSPSRFTVGSLQALACHLLVTHPITSQGGGREGRRMIGTKDATQAFYSAPTSEPSLEKTPHFCLAVCVSGSVCLSVCLPLSSHSLWGKAGTEASTTTTWEAASEFSSPSHIFKYCCSTRKLKCHVMRNPKPELTS